MKDREPVRQTVSTLQGAKSMYDTRPGSIGGGPIRAALPLVGLLGACVPILPATGVEAVSPIQSTTTPETNLGTPVLPTPTPTPAEVAVAGVNQAESVPVLVKDVPLPERMRDTSVSQYVGVMGPEVGSAEEVAARAQMRCVTIGDQVYRILVDPGTNDKDPFAGNPIMMQKAGGAWFSIGSSGLKDILTLRGVPVGTMFVGSQYRDGGRAFSSLLRSQFNGFVAENYEVRNLWAPDMPAPYPSFGDVDNWRMMAEQAMGSNIFILGQNIIDSGDTAFLQAQGITGEAAKQLFYDTITGTVKHGKGKVDAWVVLNEKGLSSPDGWASIIGQNYELEAFRTARAADPNAKLLYGDFANETLDGARTAATKSVVDSLVKEGLIDGVALHMRIDAANPPTVEQLVETFKHYGVPIYLNEITIDMTALGGAGGDNAIIQMQIAQRIGEAVAKSEGAVKFVGFFGVGDSRNFLERDRGQVNADPTLFNDDYSPKAALWGFAKGLIDQTSELPQTQS